MLAQIVEEVHEALGQAGIAEIGAPHFGHGPEHAGAPFGLLSRPAHAAPQVCAGPTPPALGDGGGLHCDIWRLRRAPGQIL